MHGEARARSGWSWPRELQMYVLCASALMFGLVAAGCQDGKGAGGGVATRLARVELRVDPASTYRPALRSRVRGASVGAGRSPGSMRLRSPGEGTSSAAAARSDELGAEGRHQSAVIAPEPVNVRVSISASDIGVLTQTVAVGAAALEFLVPQGLNRQIVLVYLDSAGAILGTGQALVNVDTDTLVVNLIILPGIPGVGISVTDTFQARNALQNRPFGLNSLLVNNTNATLSIQTAGHRFRTQGGLIDTSGSFAESSTVPASPFTVNANTNINYATATTASTLAAPALYQIDGVVQGTSSASGAFGVRSSFLPTTLRLIREHTLLLVEGTGVPGFLDHDATSPTSQWRNPTGVGRLANGDLVISDRGNNLVRLITKDAGGNPKTETAAGRFLGGGAQADGQLAINTNLVGPRGLAILTDQSIVFCESGNNKVRQFAVGGLMGTTVGNSATAGVPGFGGDGQIATADEVLLNNPEDVIVVNEPTGEAIYIADTNNHAVRRVDPVTEVITTLAGQGGLAGDSGDGGVATIARLNLPRALAVDQAGNLFIAHEFDDGSGAPRGLIRRVDAVSRVITTVAGSRSTTPLLGGFDPEGRLALLTRLGRINGIALDSSGFIYFTEQGDIVNRGRVILIDPEGNLRTVAGGTSGVLVFGPGATSAALDEPGRLLFSSGVFIFPTTQGHRILGLQ